MKQDQKTRLTVEIYGQQYRIVSQTTSDYMRMVASLVDDKMREIAATNPKLDSAKIAVLAALHFADDYYGMKEELDKRSGDIKIEHARLKEEYQKLQKEYDELIALVEEDTKSQ